MATFVAVAAPAAPAIPWALLLLSSALIFCVSWGLLHGWGRTFGALFQWLGKKAISASVRGVGFTVKPFGFLLTLDEQIRAHLGQAVAASENAMVTSFHRLVGIIVWTGKEIAGLAQDAYDAIRTAKVTVTHTVTKVVRETVVKPVTKTARATVAITKAQFNHLTHRVDVLAHRVAAIARASAGTIAAPFPRLGRLEKTVKGQAKRLTKIEKALAVGASAALVWTALRKLGLSWLRCRNVTKTGKALCGMNPDLLESLLGSALLLTGAISLRDLARELEEPTKLVADGLHALIEEF